MSTVTFYYSSTTRANPTSTTLHHTHHTASNMIPQRCLCAIRALERTFHTSARAMNTVLPELRSSNPALSSPTVAQPFSTPAPMPPPLAGSPASSSSKSAALPASSCLAGTPLKGLNYLKNREDPVALPDEEYPPWLWRCLDSADAADNAAEAGGDEFCKTSFLAHVMQCRLTGR